MKLQTLSVVPILVCANAFAQHEAADHDWASAVDNHYVAWEAEIMDLDGNTRPGGWVRVIGEGVDNPDSARTGDPAPKDDESARLVTRIRGPATIIWWWKAEPAQGDHLFFFVGGQRRAEWKDGDAAESHDGWTSHTVEVGEGEHEIAWEYQKNAFDLSDSSAADVAFVDRIRISSAVAPIIVPVKKRDEKQPRMIILEWPSVEGRVYQLMYLDDGEWKEGDKPKKASGETMHKRVRASLAVEREYQVRMVVPPSITRVPAARHLVERGKAIELRYEAEGSEPIKWRWTREPLKGGTSKMLDEAGPRLRVEHAGATDSGTYRAIATNAAGREEGSAVEVLVGAAPRLQEMKWSEDGELTVDIEFDAGRVGEIEVEPGAVFEMAGIMASTTSLHDARWERYSDDTREWEPISESACKKVKNRCEGARIELRGEAGENPATYRLWARNDFGEGHGPGFMLNPRIISKAPWALDGQLIRIYEGDETALVLELEPTGSENLGERWRWIELNVPGIHSAGKRARIGPETHDDTWCYRGTKGGLDTDHSYVAELLLGDADDRVQDQTHEVIVRVTPPAARVVHLGEEEGSEREVTMILVPIPGGRFTMGRNASQEENEGAQRLVLLTHTYWMGATEVTGAQWKALMGTTRARIGEHPAGVSHHEAVRFVERLTDRERGNGAIGEDEAYTLPTEAQWERAGRLAWPDYRALPTLEPDPDEKRVILRLEPVTQRPATCGMHGVFENAWEWTKDWYAKEAKTRDDSIQNPTGPKAGSRRTLRGGGVGLRPESVSPTVRIGIDPSQRKSSYGFRIVLERPHAPSEYRLQGSEGEEDALR